MGISIWQLLIILAIILLLFGTKKIRNIGSDLGSAIKSFRGAVREDEQSQEGDSEETAEGDVRELGQDKDEGEVIDAEVTAGKDKHKAS